MQEGGMFYPTRMERRSGQPGEEPSDEDEEESEGEEESPRRAESAGKLSPAVRRLLDEHDLDATVVTGTGRDGRITKSDIMDYLKSHSDENVAPGDAITPDVEFARLGDGAYVAKAFDDVRLTPTSIVIDKRGNIVTRILGEPDFVKLDRLIAEKLAEGSES